MQDYLSLLHSSVPESWRDGLRFGSPANLGHLVISDGGMEDGTKAQASLRHVTRPTPLLGDTGYIG